MITNKMPYLWGMRTGADKILEEIPSSIDTNRTLQLIKSGRGSRVYFGLLKTVSKEDDQEISAWLDISVKTYRDYKSNQKATRRNLTEHVIMLISLFKHGVEIFGNSEAFKEWLERDNFYFDNKSPMRLMDSISGLKFIDDRLTAMEFGDNA